MTATTGDTRSTDNVRQVEYWFSHTMQPQRRYVVTPDGDHDGPIFPNLAKNVTPTGPNQLWVADITYIAIATSFVYLAVILDAWSRRVVGYAIGWRIDARLTLAALRAAIASRAPPPGCFWTIVWRSAAPHRSPPRSRARAGSASAARGPASSHYLPAGRRGLPPTALASAEAELSARIGTMSPP